jgi:hypothetical protein
MKAMRAPNATVSVCNADGSKIRDAVVTLKKAKLEGDETTMPGPDRICFAIRGAV